MVIFLKYAKFLDSLTLKRNKLIACLLIGNDVNGKFLANGGQLKSFVERHAQAKRQTGL